jgi:putative oxidoreductase
MKKLFSTKYSDNSFSFGLFLLRIAGGGLMIPHGFDKIKKFSDYADHFSNPFHVGSTASLCLVIFAEFFCAALIVMGLFTRLACIAPIIAMTVALVTVHKSDAFGQGQTPALFLAIFLTLLFTGPGKFSMDRMMGK